VYDRDPSACTKEIAVLGLIGRDVPVPRVLYVDDGSESGTALAVLSVVEGIPLFALRQLGDADELADAVRDTGRVLARVGAYPGPPTRPEEVLGVIQRFVSVPLFVRRIPATTTEALLCLAEKWQSRLNSVRHRGLVHGDFNSPNVFVAETDDGWRVSAILDWEFARDGLPFADIGNFLRYHRADRPRYEPHFSRGLAEGGMELPDDWLTLARVADLPALCELLGRSDVPDQVVGELRMLIDETLANG
jgi:aminoglycoside phosphotransferase (APT) family kinase protein